MTKIFSFLWTLVLTAILLTLASCTSTQTHSTKDGAPVAPVDLSQLNDAIPKYEPKSPYGNPSSYMALGKRYYVLDSAEGYTKTGVASWYGTKFHGKLTSNHESYNMLAMTAASPDLPLPTYVRVTNLDNGKQVIVRVNDRGPFAADRIMDLSYAAAKKLGYAEKGTAHVQITAITIKPDTSPMNRDSSPSFRAIGFANAQDLKIYLQVGSFNQMAKAEQVKRNVSQWAGHDARIQMVTLNEKTWYRVQIGPIQVTEKPTLVNLLQQKGFVKPVTVEM